MSALKATPGPWRVVIDDDGNPLSGRPGVFASDELDCGIVHWDGFVQPYWRSARGDKEIHANAHLIAAAPDLYEAAAQLVGAFDELRGATNAERIITGQSTAPIRKTSEQAVADLRDALAKARGETL